MTAPRTILEATAVERRFTAQKPLFGDPVVVRAVDGVSLKILQGETFAIVGESGCGKSTLARVLVRLIDPSGGAVHYDGRNIAALKPAEVRALRRDLQFIFQDPFSSLNPRMTVGALIEEPLRTHNIGTKAERRARVAALLTRVGLAPQHASRYPARVLRRPAAAHRHRPRTGLLAQGAGRRRTGLGARRLDPGAGRQHPAGPEDEFGLTLIIIAHDLAVIRHMADRVAVMYLGEIVELAPAADLFATPRHPYTEALIAAIPLPEVGARRAEVRVEGDLPNPIAPPPGCRFHTRCTYAIARCSTERPVLSALPGSTAQVACHRAEELTLAGLAPGTGTRTAAASRRFDLYRQARAAQALPSEQAPQSPGPQQGDDR